MQTSFDVALLDASQATLASSGACGHHSWPKIGGTNHHNIHSLVISIQNTILTVSSKSSDKTMSSMAMPQTRRVTGWSLADRTQAGLTNIYGGVSSLTW